MTDIIELNAGGFPVKNASYWKRQYDSVCKQLAECQAKLDSVMLEFCPEDMTPEQVATWEKHQVVAKELE